MIVYVLTNNEHLAGVTVLGVYSTEEIAREEAGPPQTPPFFRAIIPVEVDSLASERDEVLIR